MDSPFRFDAVGQSNLQVVWENVAMSRPTVAILGMG
jgi:hypothetical protein